MEDLVTNNLNLINYVIKKMHIYNCFDYEDLYEEGVIGLINAAKTFNKNLNISFSTFAYTCIKNEILKYIKKNTKYEEINIDDIEDKVAEKFIDTNEVIYNREFLSKILDYWSSELDSTVIKMLYGIECIEYKQNEISKILNIPQYKISRIKTKWLKEIQDYLLVKKYRIM